MVVTGFGEVGRLLCTSSDLIDEDKYTHISSLDMGMHTLYTGLSVVS